jgi:hypothetical protein
MIFAKPYNSHMRKMPAPGNNKITAKLISGRSASEKLHVSSEISKLNAFVIWYFSRTIVCGQMLASENMASRDWKKKTAMHRKLSKFSPAPERPKIQTADIMTKNHPGIIDL